MDCVLVVDDNEAGRYAKSRTLRQAGFEVIEAGTGGDALRALASREPDLVLLDVRLPDMSGLDVCRRIKSNPETAGIPVLQMSASLRDDQSKVAGLEGGADGYITEPVEPNLLLATIAAFLRTRKAEQAVRELALEWQATFDAMTDGIALVNAQGRVMRANRSLGNLLSCSPVELIGAEFDRLFSPEPGEDIPWSSLSNGHRLQAERSAGERVFALAIDPVFSGGHLRGGVCIVSDITERKLMDQRLWHTQKLESIGVLAGGVAHDFNNLLMGILGNASLALETLNDRRSTERSLHDILRASERAADLTRQLLAYAGKGRFQVQPVDLSAAVSGMLPLVKASIPRLVKLEMNLQADLPPINADKTQIEQIVMNLLINAAEAIGESAGAVSVTTATRHFEKDQRQQYFSEFPIFGDYAVLEVRDSGAGMDEETVRRIFDPFFTTKFMGRGLGLSAVLGIMRGHKGALRVTSAIGKGTTFELLFPVAPETASEPAIETTGGVARDLIPGRGRGRILVVDDEQIVREFFETALERHGYEVVIARDGSEALRLFSEAPDAYSLVLLDLVMPVMSGRDALPRMLAIRPDARIVVTSGQVEEEARRDLAGNIVGFIQKPCGVSALLAKIRAYAGPRTLVAG